jgi:hypothetical protein
MHGKAIPHSLIRQAVFNYGQCLKRAHIVLTVMGLKVQTDCKMRQETLLHPVGWEQEYKVIFNSLKDKYYLL